MPREDFDQQLNQLQQEVEVLAGFVEKSIHRAVDALKRRDLESSRQIVQDDDYIDQKRFEIEDRCIDLIATQQPMARDLRAIIALLHIVVELERMGDYAEGIAKISLMIGDSPTLKPLIDIPRMAEKATAMLRDSIDSLLSRDVVKAHQVCNADDDVDELYDQVYRELLLFMIQDPQTIQRAMMARDLRAIIALLHIVVELERMGDYAEGIAKISLMIGDSPTLKPLIDIPRMAEKATAMLRDSIDSLLSRDVVKAHQVCNADDDVDELYDQVYRELLLFMIQDPQTIQRATYLLWVAHDLERIADRATNIAERVIYLVTGKMTEINVSKY